MFQWVCTRAIAFSVEKLGAGASSTAKAELLLFNWKVHKKLPLSRHQENLPRGVSVWPQRPACIKSLPLLRLINILEWTNNPRTFWPSMNLETANSTSSSNCTLWAQLMLLPVSLTHGMIGYIRCGSISNICVLQLLIFQCSQRFDWLPQHQTCLWERVGACKIPWPSYQLPGKLFCTLCTLCSNSSTRPVEKKHPQPTSCQVHQQVAPTLFWLLWCHKPVWHLEINLRWPWWRICEGWAHRI